MNNIYLDQDFKKCIADYDDLIEDNIRVEYILNQDQLEILDNLILRNIDNRSKKTAFIVGQVYTALEQNSQLHFFHTHQNHIDLLINQRIKFFADTYRIHVEGNVKAMKFSEVHRESQDLLLLDQTVYLLRMEENEDKTLSFSMLDIIVSGLKEQLKLLGETADDKYLYYQAQIILDQQKSEIKEHNNNASIANHIIDGSYHLKQQLKYGNKSLEHIYHYLNNIVENHSQYIPSIQNLCDYFPFEHTISLPQKIEINDKQYSLEHVKQQHKTSCTIACLSMITGVNYQDILNTTRELFNWSKHRSHLGLNIDEIQKLLLHYNISHNKYQTSNFWKECSNLTLAIIDSSFGLDNQLHTVVFFRKDGRDYVIDPFTNENVRIDFYNMRLEGFFKIE